MLICGHSIERKVSICNNGAYRDFPKKKFYDLIIYLDWSHEFTWIGPTNFCINVTDHDLTCPCRITLSEEKRTNRSIKVIFNFI